MKKFCQLNNLGWDKNLAKNNLKKKQALPVLEPDEPTHVTSSGRVRKKIDYSQDLSDENESEKTSKPVRKGSRKRKQSEDFTAETQSSSDSSESIHEETESEHASEPEDDIAIDMKNDPAPSKSPRSPKRRMPSGPVNISKTDEITLRDYVKFRSYWRKNSVDFKAVFQKVFLEPKKFLTDFGDTDSGKFEFKADKQKVYHKLKLLVSLLYIASEFSFVVSII